MWWGLEGCSLSHGSLSPDPHPGGSVVLQAQLGLSVAQLLGVSFTHNSLLQSNALEWQAYQQGGGFLLFFWLLGASPTKFCIGGGSTVLNAGLLGADGRAALTLTLFPLPPQGPQSSAKHRSI